MPQLHQDLPGYTVENYFHDFSRVLQALILGD